MLTRAFHGLGVLAPRVGGGVYLEVRSPTASTTPVRVEVVVFPFGRMPVQAMRGAAPERGG
jgi:hypothetical protein